MGWSRCFGSWVASGVPKPHVATIPETLKTSKIFGVFQFSATLISRAHAVTFGIRKLDESIISSEIVTVTM